MAADWRSNLRRKDCNYSNIRLITHTLQQSSKEFPWERTFLFRRWRSSSGHNLLLIENSTFQKSCDCSRGSVLTLNCFPICSASHSSEVRRTILKNETRRPSSWNSDKLSVVSENDHFLGGVGLFGEPASALPHCAGEQYISACLSVIGEQ